MTEDPRQILMEARQAARLGAHAEALQKYLWFHHHALEHDVALTGVRLSYALGEWFELGNAYPPALDALELVQAANSQSLQGDARDRTTFHDFASINDRLGQSGRTSSMFREIAERQPEFAKECWLLALPSLIRTRDFGLARRFATSPLVRLDSHLTSFAKLLNERQPSREDDLLIGLYARRILELMKVFEGVGEQDEAGRLQAKAIEELTSPNDREELRRQLARTNH